jgi:hypothetical protein
MDMRLEKRLSPRRNTMIDAQIVYDQGRKRMPCIIRNLSESGAKLEVVKVIGIPPTFDLVAPGHRPHACRVVWRSLKELGVQFLD